MKSNHSTTSLLCRALTSITRLAALGDAAGSPAASASSHPISSFLLVVLVAIATIALEPQSARAAIYQTLHSFSGGADGKTPLAEVIIVGSKLYGTNSTSDGAIGGVAFSMNLDGSGFQVLHAFSGGSDGSNVYSPLTPVGSKLYGTTTAGGTGSGGVIFSMSLDGSAFQTLHAFTNPNVFPQAGVTLGGSKVYGTTSGGNDGTVFSMNLDGSNYQTLHAFSGSDGLIPMGEVTLVGSRLYGTTTYGGSFHDDGTVFSMNLDGSDFQTLHVFTGSDGGHPVSQLTLVGSKLFSTTSDLGGEGTIFSIDLDGSGFQTVHAFSNGGLPYGSVTPFGSRLYGTTSQFGPNFQGTIFSMNFDGTDFQTLHAFPASTSDGANPMAGLTLAGSTLYGTASAGGTGNSGTVFALTVPEPATNMLAGCAIVCLVARALSQRRARR
jgi:uncharacterized repeat protein (TIGR03803 family)